MHPLPLMAFAFAQAANTQPAVCQPQVSYVPLWAAAIGFLGVIFTLLWNARQTLKTEKRLRTRQGIALRTSLLEELRSLDRIIDDELKHISNNNFTWVPLVESFKVYVSNLQNLGLLTSLEVEKITDAYYRYQEEGGYIARLAEDQPDKPAIGRLIKCDFAANPGLKAAVCGPLGSIRKATIEAIGVLTKEKDREFKRAVAAGEIDIDSR
jgi:hypothetical protein